MRCASRIFGSAMRVKSCDWASVDVSAGSLPKHWGLQVVCSCVLTTCCYFTPHFKAVHDTRTKSTRKLSPMLLRRLSIACMVLHRGLQPLEETHAFFLSLCGKALLCQPSGGRSRGRPVSLRGQRLHEQVPVQYSMNPLHPDGVNLWRRTL